MSTTEQTGAACPREAVFTDGRIPCVLPRGHAEPHVYGNTLLPFEDEGPCCTDCGDACARGGAPHGERM